MSITLRNYQKDAVDKVRSSLASGNRAPLLVLPTGGGKTTIFSYVTSSAAKKGKCVYLIAHRAELVKQISMTLARFGTPHQIVAPQSIVRQSQIEQFKTYGKSLVDPSSKVFVASVQTLVKRIGTYKAPDLIVVDECFPAGTMIDGRPIENLKIGDMVRSVNHISGNIEQKRITRLFKSSPKSMCTVHLDDGSQITCTSGHPFFVHFHGYFNAENLKPGMPIIKLQAVRNSCCSGNVLSKISTEESRMDFLRDGLLHPIQSRNIVKNNGKDEQEICFGQDEAEKSNDARRESSKDESHSYCDWPQASSSWREWSWNDRHTGCIAMQNSGEPSGCKGGACCCDEDEPVHGIPKTLQDRYCNSIKNDRYRSGWEESRAIGEAGVRSTEGRIPEIVRVESVEIHEPTSSGEFGRLLPDGFVYNIEVEGNHNYFAGDVLVHNCHHLTVDSSWGRVVDAYPNAKLLPVTATPCRLDGKGLGVGVGGFADDMVMGPTMRELIDGGFLSPYRIFAPPNALDLTGVRTRMGDYAKDQLADAVDKPSITGNSVEHYLRLARGKRAVAFCVSVAHAQHVAHEFNSSGVKAEFLDGTIDSLERDRIIKRFESGETLILSSCDIVSEGFDLPSIEVAILLRPTQSLSLHIQQVGRALRTSPGKSEALIFDHVGAVMRHGLPDEDRAWTLEGVKKKKRKAEDDDEEDVKVKCCPDCFSIHEPQPVCPNCGHVYEIKARKIEHIEGELKEIEQAQIEKMRRDRMLQQGKAQTVNELVQQGMSKGRAEKIIEARLAKQALQEEIFNKLSEIQVKTGFGPYQTCGLTRADILRLKPKQLKELNATITTVNN